MENHLALVYSLAGLVLNVIVPYRPNSHSRFEHAYMGDVRTDEPCESFALHLDVSSVRSIILPFTRHQNNEIIT